jgi:hypothetical protein
MGSLLRVVVRETSPHDRAGNKAWFFSALVLFAVYFPIAIYLKYSYVQAEPAKFRRLTGHSFLFKLPELDSSADSSDNSTRSTLVLREDGKLLGPAHTAHSEIRDTGLGRFSHWKGLGLIFSTSDNSDPNTNGRNYSFDTK